MRRSDRSLRAAVYAGGLATVVGSLLLWVYWFYPVLGLDFASILPAMWELRDAFGRFGVVDVDFSPARCFGLPVFANPNAFVWSLFHPFALVLPALPATVAAAATILSFAYVGCVALLRRLGLGVGLATVLAVGWCVQGFCASHLIAGHVSYLQLSVLPLLLGALSRRELPWLERALVAFWLAHLVYTSGYYLLLIGIPALLLAAGVLELLMPARLAACGLGGAATVAVNLARTAPLALVMCAPKLLAVLDFTAMFPRLTHLDRIPVWKAFAYTASQYLVPLRWDVRSFTGWWYGNWEAYEMILPGVAYWLGWTIWICRRDVPVVRVIGICAVLLGVGTLLSSGLLGPVFAALPLLRSLHVNPRWNALVLLPFFALVVGALGSLPTRALPSSRSVAVLWVIVVLVPLQLLDRRDMQVAYADGQGIDAQRHHVDFCYEPIFGYRLEHFPIHGDLDFTSDVLVDPRCYLRSAGCPPGTPFTSAADRESLSRYALRDGRALVAWLKWPALAAYLVGCGCGFAWLGRTVVGLWRDEG